MVSSRPSTCDVLADPLGAGQLGGRGQGTVGDQGEQDPLGVGVRPAAAAGPGGQGTGGHLVQAEPAPQPVQGVRAARRGRDAVTDSSPGSEAARASAGSSSRDRADTRRLTWSLSISSSRPKLCRIRVRDRCASAIPLVVGQLQVADRPGTGGPHGRLHVGHAPEATGPAPLGQIRPFPLVDLCI